MTLAIAPRAPGVDPERFWGAPWPQARVEEAGRKYAALAELATMDDGPERKAGLAAIARRWPGALREAELIGPERVDRRAREVAEGSAAVGDGGARTRRWWLERPGVAAREVAAVLCWSELHASLGDQLRFRQGSPKDWPGGLVGFVAWLDACPDPSARARWLPGLDKDAVAGLLGPRLRVRAAYLCLAARAGLPLAELNATLFARAGHWDERPGDPDWAR